MWLLLFLMYNEKISRSAAIGWIDEVIFFMISNKDRKREARKLMKKPAGQLEAVDLRRCEYVPNWMTRAYKNNRYVVMINDNAMTTHGPAIRAMIQRHDDMPVSWAEKQAVKNEIFGNESVAIEYYPAEKNLINHHNIYWLWIWPDKIMPMPLI